MRGIAIACALLFHAGVPFAGGGYIGIEMFFVLSGFLITSLLIKELDGSGTISLHRFYAYRVKRLLPLAVFTLVTIAVVSAIVLSPVRNDVVSGDVTSAAFYLINWHYTAEAVDYFAGGLEASPVQHFWSLAIEEQFYILWPALLLAVTWLPRRIGRSPRPALWLAVGSVVVASLAYNLAYTPEAPSAAYFSTLTRAWELALGGLLALIVLPPISRRLAAALAFGAFGALAFSVLSYDELTPYPGTAALIPTMATVALIIAGTATTSPMPVRFLAWGPVRYVGRISYSWYLWHWPTLVFAGELFGPLTVAEGLLVVGVSWIPTHVTHHLIERPVRYSNMLSKRPRRTLAIGAGCTASAAAAGLLLFTIQPTIPTAPPGEVEGALALARQTTPQKKAKALRPNPREAQKDSSIMHRDDCLVPFESTKVKRCAYGKKKSRTSVVLVGDSTAFQYANAFVALARRREWRLVGIGKAGCMIGDVHTYSGMLGRSYDECDEWRERTLRVIEEREKPDLVVVSTSPRHKIKRGGKLVGGRKRVAELERGYVRTLERLRETGAQVRVMAELPLAPEDLNGCVAKSRDRLDRCAFKMPRRTAKNSFASRATAQVRKAELIDTATQICPKRLCRAVIGDAVVFRDRNHITGTFARTLASWIKGELPRLR